MEMEAMWQKLRIAMDPQEDPDTCVDYYETEEEIQAERERYLKENPPLKEEILTVTIPKPEELEPEK